MKKIKTDSHLLIEHLVCESLNGLDFEIDLKRFFVPTLDKHDEQTVTLIESEKAFDNYNCTLTFLIYCLDTSSSSKIVFLPKPAKTPIFGGNPIKVYDDHCTKKLFNGKKLHSYSDKAFYGIKGVVLNGKFEDEKLIPEAENILRYASSKQVAHLLNYDLGGANEEDVPIRIFCPIMVTNCSLHVLENGISPEKLRQEDSIMPFADEADFLIYESQYDERDKEDSQFFIQNFLNRNHHLENRLNNLKSILQDRLGSKHIPLNPYFFAQNIARAAEYFIITNINKVESEMSFIETLLEESLESIEKFAEISYDATKQKLNFKPNSE